MMRIDSVNNPDSLLFVCVGNTCRGPIAEAFARQRWPNSRVMSAGTKIQADSKDAAGDAVYVLKRYYGLDICNHKTASLQDIDVGAFQFVVALDKNVKRELIEEYLVPESKIIDLFVDDPFGDDLVQYRKTAERISRGIKSLENSN